MNDATTTMPTPDTAVYQVLSLDLDNRDIWDTYLVTACYSAATAGIGRLMSHGYEPSEVRIRTWVAGRYTDWAPEGL